MYSFPLENKPDEIEKEELEKKELEKEEIKKQTDSSSFVQSDIIPYIKPIPIIIGSIICFVVLLNMIVLFVVPYQRIRTNKRKLPDAKFEKPDSMVIGAHFILHAVIILNGVLLILYGFRKYKYIDNFLVGRIIIYLAPSTFLIWILTVLVGFFCISNIYPKMAKEELISLISKNPPINFAFIYSECLYDDGDSEKRYSKNGIIFPMKTNITSSIYNFSNTPELFFFVIDQKVNISSELKTYFSQVFFDANSCDKDTVQKVQYYPIIQGDYFVSKRKTPIYLNKATRITSILFGVGVYYELNFKSIPYITYVQYLNADIAQGVNYNQIFTPETCETYGKCSHSDMPKPQL